MNDQIIFDDIVVGGGTSGAVLASRLAEDDQRQVLLLEAGPDFADTAMLPKLLQDVHWPVLSGFNWNYTARVRGCDSLPRPESAAPEARMLAGAPRFIASAQQTMPYPLGKVIGGSSSVNAAVALRPFPSDFEAWAQQAGPTWAWDKVFPFFRALEHDRNFQGELHGRDGPMSIGRTKYSELAREQRAFLEACTEAGMSVIDDLNGSALPGVGLVPSNTVNGLRMSSAVSYLMPARHRRNLHVRGRHEVRRVLFEGPRAVGVEALHDGQPVRYHGRRVTISAGAINTPAVLLRSGIGDSVDCLAPGAPVVSPLRAVGRNLMDHPAVTLWLRPPSADAATASQQSPHQVMARACSIDGAPPDLNLFFVGCVDTGTIPMLRDMLGVASAHALSVSLNRPTSRGQVSLNKRDPAAAPTIDLNLADTAEDVERLMAGVRLAWQMLRSQVLAAQARSVLMWTDATISSDRLLRSAILRTVTGTWHAAGTARMGPASDPDAVVDAHFRVHGVNGLRIVDASVMPTLPSTPTNLTCLMLAERAARWMTAED